MHEAIDAAAVAAGYRRLTYPERRRPPRRPLSARRSKETSLAIVSGAYVVAIAAAAAWLAWGPGTGHLWLDTLIADVIATVVV